MATKQDNVATLRQCYRDWIVAQGRDGTVWTRIFADEFHFGSAGGGSRRPGYFRATGTIEDLQAYFEGLARDWKMIEYRTDEFIAQGDSVVMRGFCEWEYRRTGKRIACIKFDYWRFDEGRVVEFYKSFDTAAMLAAMEP